MNVFLASLLIDIDIISLLISIIIFMFAISDDHQSWTRSVLLCIFSCPSWNIVYLSYNFQWHSTISTWKYASYLVSQCVSLPIFQHNVLFSFLTMFMFSNKMMMIYCLSCYQWQYFSITISTCNTYTDTSAILTTTSLYAHISININLESILVLLWLLSPLILSTVIMIFFLQGIGLESVDN